jgi:hypothetical protein
MLSVFLTEEFETVAQSQDAALVYFFCSSSDNRRNTAVAVLRGLIFQLIQQYSKLFEHILPAFKVRKEALFNDSPFESLWRIFESMVRDPSIDSIFCVLDGLDECDEHSLEVLTEKLRDFFSKSPTSLKLIAVSRELPDCIPRAMSGFPNVRLDPDPGVNRDLGQFITIKVNELSSKKSYSDKLRASVESTLLERANGTFLWVGFVIGELRKKTRAEVEDTLNRLHPGLEGMYERMLLQIHKDRRDIAASILRWVTMAVRPLTLTELGEATGIRPPTNLSIDEAVRDYVNYCGYLLTVTGSEVGLVHQSAKDYLQRDKPYDGEHEFYRVKKTEAHLEVAKTCFKYIQRGPFLSSSILQTKGHSDKEVSSIFQEYPLLEYASLYWPEHSRYASDAIEDMFDFSGPFCQKKSKIRKNWLRYYWKSEYNHYIAPISFTLMHLAAYFGITPLARKLVRMNKMRYKLPIQNPGNMRDSEGRTPLSRAAERGHEAVVKLLLENGANIEIKEKGGGTPLTRAIENGSEAVIKLLLTKGVKVNYLYLPGVSKTDLR